MMYDLTKLDLAKLGERLRIARNSAGLTQEQVAERLSLARTSLVSIEAGERAPKPEQLVALSELYDVSTNLLLREQAVHVDLVGQFRRTRVGPKYAAGALAAIQVLNRLAAGYAELESRLGARHEIDYPPERHLARGQLDAQAEDLAMEVRSRIGVGAHPISDLVSLLELELGVRVFVHSLDSNVAGVYGFNPTVGACILINSKHPPGRQLWTLAHELAHFLTSRRSTLVLFMDEQVRDPLEIFADRFAAALLMPGSTIRRLFADESGPAGFTTRNLILLAHRFHTSLEAMARRLEQLGLLKQGTFEVLKKKGLSNEVVQSVLGDVEVPRLRLRPPRLTLLAITALSKELMSERQLAELLALGVVELRTLADELGPEVALGDGHS